jgi:glutamyl-tRNA synthetase
MKNNTDIADILLPHTSKNVENFASIYPDRNLGIDAQITRFGPSPTGFLHIGGLFAALISERLAHSSGGIFFLRVEDTDKKREVENSVSELTDTLIRFGLKIDEGISNSSHPGAYGPYLQSERKDIYLTYIKYLLITGNAYPCFCTPEELEAIRNEQENLKIRPGYYGKWAVHRDITPEEIEKNLSEGKSFVIRLKSNPSSIGGTHKFTDEIKGEVSVTENDQDIVLLKSDGLPTYHLAHPVDDHLMGTTLVIRGDEWLSSLSIHLQLFKMFGWKVPKYGHISPILKSENGNKRKLSKRKDPEAAVEYYLNEGYPNEAVIEYLLNIANSDFENWRKENPLVPNYNFKIKLSKFSKSGALFDINKLNNISKEIISRMPAEQVYDLILSWAQQYDKEFAIKISNEKEYFIKILSIEKTGTKPRKDFSKWSEVKDSTFYFFDDLFEKHTLDDNVLKIKDTAGENIRLGYADRFLNKAFPVNKEEWFDDLKLFAAEMGYATDMRDYKDSPEKYKGSVGDIAMILRVVLTSKTQTPDLFEMIQVIGKERVIQRLRKI